MKRHPSRARPPAEATPPAEVTSNAAAAEEDLDEESPVSVAFERAWVRAKTEVAGLGEELRSQSSRLDALVVCLALAVIWLAGRWHRHLVTPPLRSATELGLTMGLSEAWQPAVELPRLAPRLVRDTPPPPRQGALPYEVAYASKLDPNARIEVYIDEPPSWGNLAAVLELRRVVRFGSLAIAGDGRLRTIAGHDWLRTSYQFAATGASPAVASPDQALRRPVLGNALEFATIDREHVYVVTLVGTAAEVARMEETIVPTLRVASHTGMPLLPQARHILGVEPPPAVVAQYPTTVMIVAADVIRGQLRAVGGGSGVVVSADGSILTNFHVVHDKGDRLHDLFVVARYRAGRLMPQMTCVGRPGRSKLLPANDIALIKCDADLDGRSWSAKAAREAWPAVDTSAPALATSLGQALWVLGYPDVGGGSITVSPGAITGYTGDAGVDEYIKTDAAISQGNSGGPVFDADGRLLGVATAYRTVIASDGVVSETTKIGLMRPISAALDVLFIARMGWTPRDGRTAVNFAPVGVEVPAEGVYLRTSVIDAQTKRPIAGALVMVMKPGLAETDVDMNRLEDSVTAWGSADAEGAVAFRQPVPTPGTYSVLVVASGYRPRFAQNEVTLPADTPDGFNPWQLIELNGYLSRDP